MSCSVAYIDVLMLQSFAREHTQYGCIAQVALKARGRGVIVLELALHGLLAAAHKYCCFERQTFVKFDTARGTMQALADSLDLTALPSFRVFKNGQAVGKDVVGHKHQPLVDAVQAL